MNNEKLVNLWFEKGKKAYKFKSNEALKYLRDAAEAGHAEAQYYLGCCYFYGECGVDEDENEAVKWITMAAEAGCTEAQDLLGDMYNHGWGVPYSAYDAYQWYLKSGNTIEAEKLVRIHEMMQ